MKEKRYSILLLGFPLMLFILSACARATMEEPVLTKKEYGFYNELKSAYRCKIKRTQSVKKTPKKDSHYALTLFDFPQKQFDKGNAFLEVEAYRIALQIKNVLFERMEVKYSKISIVFLTKRKSKKEFSYQYNDL